MTLALRAVFLDGEHRPDDYEFRYEGAAFFACAAPAMSCGTGLRPAGPSRVPNLGVADSPDEAKAALGVLGGSVRSRGKRTKNARGEYFD